MWWAQSLGRVEVPRSKAVLCPEAPLLGLCCSWQLWSSPVSSLALQQVLPDEHAPEAGEWRSVRESDLASHAPSSTLTVKLLLAEIPPVCLSALEVEDSTSALPC